MNDLSPLLCRSTTFTSRTEGHAVWPTASGPTMARPILQAGAHVGGSTQKISGSEFRDPEPLVVWPSFTCGPIRTIPTQPATPNPSRYSDSTPIPNCRAMWGALPAIAQKAVLEITSDLPPVPNNASNGPKRWGCLLSPCCGSPLRATCIFFRRAQIRRVDLANRTCETSAGISASY